MGILRRKTQVKECPIGPKHALIPAKHARIRGPEAFFTSEKNAANSSIWTTDLFPDRLLHAENEKNACFRDRVLGHPHTGHLTRDRSDTRDGSATCDRFVTRDRSGKRRRKMH